MMEQRIDILSIADYDREADKGEEILTSPDYFIPIRIREEIQKMLFPTDDKFYRYCWEWMPHTCEECKQYLSGYSAHYISHICTKGAHPEKRRDPRNVNILCARCHDRWEFRDRSNMRIFKPNEILRVELIQEYGR